ncbi:CBS domain-containing protein [Corallococcus sp. ZKHCc1 1396]|uniref:CBS domain-containing protein n=1 Tax=Corallococcus soli TaxID=2710757 RepID=A0ABR9PSS9_9BACT|nr:MULTISPECIES: CBS domain-containing protein [Corallococcus]MBE4750978.1 CBS domain-containing protein [Corallococcus soli]MCY1034274.1 CBS domain-containing protein [Corallococcus sp. BB11-1]
MAMQRVSEVMTPDVETLRPSDSLKVAAIKMRDLDVGPMPVCDGDELVGIVTDRDIVVRAVAQGLDMEGTQVAQAMTRGVDYVFEDDDVTQAAEKMRASKIRRILVLNQDKRLVGILALGDIAEELDAQESGRTLGAISADSAPAPH